MRSQSNSRIARLKPAVLAALALLVIIAGALPCGARDLAAILRQVEDYVPEVMEQSQVPGLAMAFVVDGEVVYEGAFGAKSQGGDDPVTTETIFQIGSCSKAFTAVTVAGLADDGYLDWSDQVIEHLPGFAMFDTQVTQQFEVDDLMAQRSGLTAYSGDFQTYLGFSREHLVDSLRCFRPVSDFRTEYAYQNGFFIAASELVAEYRGTSWEDALASEVLEPLGMASTTITEQAYYSEPNRAALYAHMTDGTIAQIPDDWPYNDCCYNYAPAGGINSNVADMAKWVIFNLGDGAYDGQRILSESNLDWLHTPHTAIPQGFYTRGGEDFYCQGWFYCPDEPYPTIQHGGNTLGAHSLVSLVPEAGIGAVVLTNTGSNLAAEALAWRFEDLYLDRELRDVFAASSSSKGQGAASLALAEARDDLGHPYTPDMETCAGVYENPIYGQVFVYQLGDDLGLVIGTEQVRMGLTALGGGEYKLEWPEGIYITGSTDFGKVRFGDFGPDGAQNMVIELINYDTGGSFTRI